MGTRVHTCVQTEIGRCHQIWQTVAYSQEWQVASSQTGGRKNTTTIPTFTGCRNEVCLGPHGPHLAEKDQGPNGRQNRRKPISILSRAFLQRKVHLFSTSAETDAGPQSHCHLPGTSCVPPFLRLSWSGHLRVPSKGPAYLQHAPTLQGEQSAEEENSLGPQMALSTNPLHLDF